MILVTGATGHVGSEVVRALVGAGERVRTFSRSGGRTAGTGTEHAGHSDPGTTGTVETVLGDLNDPASLAPALSGVRAVFLMPGYDRMGETLGVLRRAGVERVVMLSGSSAGSGNPGNVVSAYMVASEAAVRDSGLSWTFLRPVAFMSNALDWREQVAAGDTVRVPFAGVRVAVVDPYDIGVCAALALTDEDGTHDGRVHALSGPESLLPAERVRILGEVLGRELRLVAEPDAEARARMSALMPTEYVDAFFDFYVRGSIDESAVLPTVRELTGRPPRTFREWARANAASFPP
ncbi:NAD(P)H-binding protein [Streptomyces liangshanensis]|uniref:NAD(P)H-binding protein n=1 Tax=Streptomyces liangshanensis TaxID=2717324 RepID=UPI0036D79E45